MNNYILFSIDKSLQGLAPVGNEIQQNKDSNDQEKVCALEQSVTFLSCSGKHQNILRPEDNASDIMAQLVEGGAVAESPTRDERKRA